MAPDGPDTAPNQPSIIVSFAESGVPVLFWDRKTAAVLSPLIGGIAPAVWLWFRGGAKLDESAIPGVCVWGIRDMLISYAIALPTLMLCRRLGARRAVTLWLTAALVGSPMGYVLANPVEFAWTPTEAEFAHGPYWDVMLIYMALFGLTGLLYAAGRERQPERVSVVSHKRPL